jgi:hypothetical protein
MDPATHRTSTGIRGSRISIRNGGRSPRASGRRARRASTVTSRPRRCHRGARTAMRARCARTGRVCLTRRRRGCRVWGVGLPATIVLKGSAPPPTSPRARTGPVPTEARAAPASSAARISNRLTGIPASIKPSVAPARKRVATSASPLRAAATGTGPSAAPVIRRPALTARGLAAGRAARASRRVGTFRAWPRPPAVAGRSRVRVGNASPIRSAARASTRAPAVSACPRGRAASGKRPVTATSALTRISAARKWRRPSAASARWPGAWRVRGTAGHRRAVAPRGECFVAPFPRSIGPGPRLGSIFLTIVAGRRR